ncbi:hypothetical protein BDV41DRAFT_559232 [Aspergillus transmontanensis]|uniref:Uncharacterized protein n=1 Tax=Aspergillus transmontanensis TaxID=1034304 RepID=A0A5N6VCR3_9EURO|nr:hypothetical protein BDV41DRAFT_559232 [Aspergillus transmontanensis]
MGHTLVFLSVYMSDTGTVVLASAFQFYVATRFRSFSNCHNALSVPVKQKTLLCIWKCNITILLFYICLKNISGDIQVYICDLEYAS